jgi:hypothetical protein
VTPFEVQQDLYNRPRPVAGREHTREVLGTTDANRYLFILVAEAADGRDFVITARDTTSIRLAQSLVNQVREQAAALGIPATALMRQWVIERATSPNTAAVGSVADLQQFVAEQSRPVAS